MISQLRNLLLVALATTGIMASAGNDPDFLFKRQIKAHPAPAFEDVAGREYKFLIDATKAKGTPAEAFKVMWTQVKASATKQGFTVTEKDKNPLKIEMTTKEYFDTADHALWKQGYLIRITTKYKAGIADEKGKVTVKAIFEDPAKTIATPLEVVGVKSEEECQDNAGIGKGGQLVGYIEKGASFSVALDDLGKMTLGDFAKYMPELLKLGLSGDTKLVSNKAYSYRVRPGYVVLPGTEPCGVSMEGWSLKEDGPIFLYDFSYGYDGFTLYENPETHMQGELFMSKVLIGDLAGLALADDGKWGGSKVRIFLKRPITK
ncbi:MAG: hypothetical protein IPN91_14080 [Holophagaceae bacterium]|jgi:hypothetical protein|uniref:Uncharacterized protein n=1 Tax=Candidatus Geothrix odensensis TaxID=2954440 RepID=A0A936F476_9BACT|nr:hypothetical protein [Candidatus Geothrix odensensis]